MTPDQITAALEQPEFHNPLRDLAKAEIALERALIDFRAAASADGAEDLCSYATDAIVDSRAEFFDDMAKPFELTVAVISTVEEIIEDYYNSLKATLLEKEALNND